MIPRLPDVHQVQTIGTILNRMRQNTSYYEITDKNIGVRGNDNYGIYSLGEDILFDQVKAAIRTGAAKTSSK